MNTYSSNQYIVLFARALFELFKISIHTILDIYINMERKLAFMGLSNRSRVLTALLDQTVTITKMGRSGFSMSIVIKNAKWKCSSQIIRLPQFRNSYLHTNTDPHIWTSVMNTKYETIQTSFKVICKFCCDEDAFEFKIIRTWRNDVYLTQFFTFHFTQSLFNNKSFS